MTLRLQSIARSGHATPDLQYTVPVTCTVACPTDAAWTKKSLTPMELREIVVTTTDRESLTGLPQRHPERSFTCTLVPTRTRITHGEFLDTTWTAGLATTPHAVIEFETLALVVVAPTTEPVTPKSDDVTTATTSDRRRVAIGVDVM